MAHVATGAREGLANEDAFHSFQTKLIEALGGSPNLAEAQIGTLHSWSAGHENGALDGVVQLADISRPAVLQQGFERRRLKPGNGFSIARGVARQKVAGKQGNIFAAITQRRQVDFY